VVKAQKELQKPKGTNAPKEKLSKKEERGFEGPIWTVKIILAVIFCFDV
jgi:hypothetical protein